MNGPVEYRWDLRAKPDDPRCDATHVGIDGHVDRCEYRPHPGDCHSASTGSVRWLDIGSPTVRARWLGEEQGREAGEAWYEDCPPRVQAMIRSHVGPLSDLVGNLIVDWVPEPDLSGDARESLAREVGYVDEEDRTVVSWLSVSMWTPTAPGSVPESSTPYANGSDDDRRRAMDRMAD